MWQKALIAFIFLWSAKGLSMEITPYLASTDISYREESGDGATLLRENGSIYGGGLFLTESFPIDKDGKRGVAVGFRAQLTKGTIDYDGQTQSGIPLSADVSYQVEAYEPQLVYIFHGYSDIEFSVIGGVRYNRWQRKIKETPLTQSLNLDYDWLTWRFGLGAEKRLSSLTLGIKLFYARHEDIEIDISSDSTGRFTLDAGADTGSEASLYTLYELTRSVQLYGVLGFEEFRFRRGKDREVGTSVFTEPASRTIRKSISVGARYTF